MPPCHHSNKLSMGAPGISAPAFLPDLQCAPTIPSTQFQSKPAHESAGVLKTSPVSASNVFPNPGWIASAKSPNFIFIPAGMSPSISTILPARYASLFNRSKFVRDTLVLS